MTVLRLGVLVVLLGVTISQSASGQDAGKQPVLAYKLVDWPIPPTSAAGFQAIWNFRQVAGVAVTPRGNVLVLHRGAHPVLEFDPGGTLVRSWGDGIFSEGKVDFIPKANYADDTRSRYSVVYGPAGCTSCGAHAVRVDGQGNIWLVDAAGQVVYKTSPDGKEIMRLGTKGVSGTSSSTFNLPTDVAFGPGGDVYVSDGYGNARVVKFSSSGKFLLQWGKRGTGPGEFMLPHNLVTDAQGRVYVTDRDNQRIEVFDANGKFLDQWIDTGGVSALVMSTDQQIWTGDVLRDLQGRVVGRLPEAAGPHGMTVTNTGEVYLVLLSPQMGRFIQKFVRR